MAIPIHLTKRLAWGRIKEKTKVRLLKAIPNRAYFAMVKRQRHEIVVLANRLKMVGMTEARLRDHFKELKKTASTMEIGQRMIEDLQATLELAERTHLIGKGSTNQTRMDFKRNLANRPLTEILEEMKEQYQGMQQVAMQKAGKKVA